MAEILGIKVFMDANSESIAKIQAKDFEEVLFRALNIIYQSAIHMQFDPSFMTFRSSNRHKISVVYYVWCPYVPVKLHAFQLSLTE